MARTFHLGSASLCLLLALCMAFSLGQAKEKRMILYFQDFAFGPKMSYMAVAGIPGKEWNYTNFGTIFTTDDLITEGPNISSAVVGRAQGTYVVASLDGLNLIVSLSLVFTNRAYNGSTIQVQGTSRQFDPNRELAVIGGTGQFRFARGFATSNNYFFDIPSGYTIAQFNVTIKH